MEAEGIDHSYNVENQEEQNENQQEQNGNKQEENVVPEGGPVYPAIQPNPWSANSVQDFCFYCCPECSFRSHAMGAFQDHAVEKHPLVRQ